MSELPMRFTNESVWMMLLSPGVSGVEYDRIDRDSLAVFTGKIAIILPAFTSTSQNLPKRT